MGRSNARELVRATCGCLQARLLAASGACLCVHFGLWVYSVQTTSLAHSLLFVSATPLFLAGGAWLLRRPISRGELAGTAVGLAGAVLLATAAARSDAQVGLLPPPSTRISPTIQQTCTMTLLTSEEW